MAASEWEGLSVRLVERELQPTAILDEEARLVAASPSFIELLGLRGSQGVNLLAALDVSSRRSFSDALPQARRAGRASVVVTPRHSSRVVDLALELEAAPPSRAVLVRVVNVQPRRQGLPVGPVAGRTYDVSISSRRILRAAPPLSESELSDADAPCYRQLFGASHECRGCPVASLEGASARSACVVVPTPGEGAHRCGQPWAVLAYSERIDGKTVRVTYVPVDQSLYSALVDRRIDSLVENPALTTREREVLRFILNCADEAELASRLGVSTRTVKFHQMNLLRKLKLDSKAALFALLR